jgi:Sel1 repeat
VPLPPVHSPKREDIAERRHDKRAPKMPMSQKRDDHSRRTAVETTVAPRSPVDPDSAPPTPSSGRRRSATAQRHETLSDLERLEACLLQVQREEATRLPRAAQLPPVPGLAPVDEKFDDRYRAPRSLEPESLAVPDAVMLRRERQRWPLMVLIAGTLSAPIAYYLLMGGWAPPTPRAPQMVSVDPLGVAPLTASTDGVGSLARSDTSSQITKTSPTARSPEAGMLATLQQNEAGIQEASKKPVRAIDPDEIKLLMKQGEQFAEVGDLVTARLLFQRAAEAGDATAATALGATYDPILLTKLGAVGISADVEKARFWYEKAASLGSSDARRRLDLLANR